MGACNRYTFEVVWLSFHAESDHSCPSSDHSAESPAYKLPVFLLQLRNLLSVKMAVF